MKLNRAIGIFSKLRYNANLSVLKIIYHSLLYLALMKAKDPTDKDYFSGITKQSPLENYL